MLTPSMVENSGERSPESFSSVGFALVPRNGIQAAAPPPPPRRIATGMEGLNSRLSTTEYHLFCFPIRQRVN